MRKFSCIGIFAISIFSSPAIAENMVGKVRKAVERCTLNQPGTKPFHLKATVTPSFERDKDSGRNGEIEVWWASPNQWRREIRSPNFHQVEIFSNNHEWQKNEGDYFPEWLRETAVQLINPLPSSDEVLEHVKTAETKNFKGQINIEWTATTGTAEVRNIQRFALALQPSTGLLLYTYGFSWGAEFKDYRDFHGRMVSRAVNIGTPQVTAKVETLEDLGEVAPGFFNPDAKDGDPGPLRTELIDEPTLRKNLLPMKPVAWPTIQDGSREGNVTTWIVVDREGRVREIDGIVSENSAVNDTGRAAVMNMHFNPFVVGGIPAQVVSQFTLPFKTTWPAGTEVSPTVQKSAPTDQDLTTDQTQLVMKLANLQKNFGKKMNSPGVDLSLREINRWRASDRTFVKYELYSTGLPTNLTYSLEKVQISGIVLKQLDGITIASDGRAICAGRKGTCSGSEPNSPIDLVFFAGKTEPIRLGLVSKDDPHVKGFIQAMPFPNSITDKACTLESIIGTPKGEVTFIQGRGFEPGEEITTDSESYGDKNHSVSRAEADGSYFAAALPNVLGKTFGTTIWSVKGKNCSPSLTFSWGTYQLE